jgi:tyrosine-protein kinase Etk/Wzc
MQENENIEVNQGEGNHPLHYLVIILKRKKMIAGITLAFALITAGISLFMTPIYQAETKILPPQQSSSGISSQVLSRLNGGASGLISSSLGITSSNALYVGMLKSRTLYDYIIDRFDLMNLFKTKDRESARTRLANSVVIQSGKDGLISVSVMNKDPKLAADIANAFIEKLKEITQTLAVTEASKRRLFFEEQMAKVKEALITSEDAMQRFQEKSGAISINDQAKAIIESITEVRAQIAAREVEIKVMKTYTEPRNPDLQKSEEALQGMKEELQKLETKSGEAPDPLVPTGKIPEIGADYTRNLRELKYQETLFELLANQYEIARVDEAKDATIIQVLDKAVPSDTRVKPKRKSMVSAATFSGFFIAILTAFLMEFVENASGDEKNRKMIELIRKHSFFWRGK